MYVIGTAGHIDHGKTTLIRVLTNIDPDRLKEEQARGMTIDLGFAWLTLPSGREAGIVDVPGHHRFIRNMLAGVGGIRLVLFVVAANESWMPQSQEHLEILDLLGVDRGIVVLTKSDLVDPEWLALVEEDVRERLRGTALERAPIIPVSSTTGQGLERLVQAIDDMLAQLPPPVDHGRPRLWVDRVFSIRGAGTVVTGTLEGGRLRLDQEVEILPLGRRARVRGLQTHKRAVAEAVPGSRVAVNLAGIDAAGLERGVAVCGPGQRRATAVINAGVRLLPRLDRVPDDLAELMLYVGSAEIACRVRWLEPDALLPGETVMAQLWLSQATPVQFGDRIILRDPARQETIGGGRVLDAAAERVRVPSLRLPPRKAEAHLPGLPRERRLRLDLLKARWPVANGPAEDYGRLVAILVEERQVVPKEELRWEVPLPPEALQAAMDALVAGGHAVALPSYMIDRAAWDAFAAAVRDHLRAYHQRYPLRPGPARETVRTTLGVSARLFDEALARLVQEGAVAAEEATLRLPEHRVHLGKGHREAADRVLQALRANPYAPPVWDELLALPGVDAELLNALVYLGELVKVSQDLVLPADVMRDIQERVRAHILTHGSVDVATLRDLLNTSRKYAVPILEYLDQIEFTRRVGDVRVLAAGAGERDTPEASSARLGSAGP
ncbi:MAG: selenocysteine-specific translation elongation factor [Limnochordales bacterium]